MTLFGTTLDGPQIAALVGLLVTLALWLIVLGRERGYSRWLRDRMSDRDGRRKATRKDPDGSHGGPWG